MSQTVGDSIGLGGRIATARINAGIRTQMEFARQLGVTRSAVSEWERGKSSPSTGNLSRIARLTGKNFDWLATGRTTLATGRTTRAAAFNMPPSDPLAKVALDRITSDTPLRLNVAAALAYPDGSMTASGLRKEAQKGYLILERTAGKYYTTLAAITRMRQLCRQNPKIRGSDCTKPFETTLIYHPLRHWAPQRRQPLREHKLHGLRSARSQKRDRSAARFQSTVQAKTFDPVKSQSSSY